MAERQTSSSRFWSPTAGACSRFASSSPPDPTSTRPRKPWSDDSVSAPATGGVHRLRCGCPGPTSSVSMGDVMSHWMLGVLCCSFFALGFAQEAEPTLAIPPRLLELVPAEVPPGTPFPATEVIVVLG